LDIWLSKRAAAAGVEEQSKKQPSRLKTTTVLKK
jgi:hypothetical protein